MSDLRKVFADNLDARREALGLSPADFARLLGVSASYASQLRSGKIGFKAESLLEMAEKLECEPWELIKPREAPTMRDLPPVPHADIGKQIGAPGYVAEPAKPYDSDHAFTKEDAKELAVAVAKEITKGLAEDNERLRAELDAAKAEITRLNQLVSDAQKALQLERADRQAKYGVSAESRAEAEARAAEFGQKQSAHSQSPKPSAKKS